MRPSQMLAAVTHKLLQHVRAVEQLCLLTYKHYILIIDKQLVPEGRILATATYCNGKLYKVHIHLYKIYR